MGAENSKPAVKTGTLVAKAKAEEEKSPSDAIRILKELTAEIKGVSAPTTTLFPNGKKIIYQNCGTDLPIRASGRMQIVIASELPPPIISALEIIIV